MKYLISAILSLSVTGCADYWVIEEQLKEIAHQQKRATDHLMERYRRCGGY